MNLGHGRGLSRRGSSYIRATLGGWHCFPTWSPHHLQGVSFDGEAKTLFSLSRCRNPIIKVRPRSLDHGNIVAGWAEFDYHGSCGGRQDEGSRERVATILPRRLASSKHQSTKSKERPVPSPRSRGPPSPAMDTVSLSLKKTTG